MESADGTDTAPVHVVSAEGFSLQVEAYEQGRPSYPPVAVDYALTTLGLHEPHEGSFKVVDLAAGTGKLTRLLVQQPQLEVTAVEPNEAMIGGFRRAVPGVPIVQGTAQQLPFADGSVDAVFVGQGFHWFAHEAALKEIHRVLRPGTGGLCLIWNREDVGIPWARDLLGIFEPLSRGIPQYWTGDWVKVWEGDWARRHFQVPSTDPRSHSKFFRGSIKMTREQVWQRIVSRSYVARLGPQELEEVRHRFNAVLQKHADQFHTPAAPAPAAEVADVPQQTEVFAALVRGSE